MPPDGYLPGVAAACKAANVLFIADEIRRGSGVPATLAVDHEQVKPDVVLLGKGARRRDCPDLSGGLP